MDQNKIQFMNMKFVYSVEWNLWENKYYGERET